MRATQRDACQNNEQTNKHFNFAYKNWSKSFWMSKAINVIFHEFSKKKAPNPMYNPLSQQSIIGSQPLIC